VAQVNHPVEGFAHGEVGGKAVHLLAHDVLDLEEIQWALHAVVFVDDAAAVSLMV